ncbi:hypothetical protein D3C77_369130 [compost metagenome]
MDFNEVGLKPDIIVNNNATAQLISGLYKAGARKIELTGNAAGVTLNGSSFSGYLDVIQSGKKTYAPSRILTSLLRGDVAWNTKSQKLTITNRDSKSAVFTKASGNVKIVDNETYVELNEFKRQFPSFSWSYSNDTINMAYQ